MPRVMLASLLVGLVVMLPLTFAHTPDPVWIGGLYDGADFDEIAEAVMSMAATPSPVPAAFAAPVPLRTGQGLAAAPAPPVRQLPACPPRAPPAG